MGGTWPPPGGQAWQCCERAEYRACAFRPWKERFHTEGTALLMTRTPPSAHSRHRGSASPPVLGPSLSSTRSQPLLTIHCVFIQKCSEHGYFLLFNKNGWDSSRLSRSPVFASQTGVFGPSCLGHRSGPRSSLAQQQAVSRPAHPPGAHSGVLAFTSRATAPSLHGSVPRGELFLG